MEMQRSFAMYALPNWHAKCAIIDVYSTILSLRTLFYQISLFDDNFIYGKNEAFDFSVGGVDSLVEFGHFLVGKLSVNVFARLDFVLGEESSVLIRFGFERVVSEVFARERIIVFV